VRAVFIEAHRVGCAGIHLRATARELRGPGSGRIWLWLPIEATEQLEGEPRPLFNGELKNLGQDIWGRPWGSLPKPSAHGFGDCC
jgi:hypothetical protein